ncbi:hypothetical protein GCK32_003334 [Trichostrongylus colubriformis]|uniref:Secreted protein n=1 Tax=Trichostrongylus colubriformis TaxID=6319 RepID=A0AAN8IRA3_TRICO
MQSLATVLLVVMPTTFHVYADPGDGNKRIVRENAPPLERAILMSVKQTLYDLGMADVSSRIDSLLESDGWDVVQMISVVNGFKNALEERIDAGGVAYEDAIRAQNALIQICHAFTSSGKCNITNMQDNMSIFVDSKYSIARLRELVSVIELALQDMLATIH